MNYNLNYKKYGIQGSFKNFFNLKIFKYLYIKVYYRLLVGSIGSIVLAVFGRYSTISFNNS